MTTSALLASAASGLLLGLSLIIAIGAQNAFVLRQGVRRQHVLIVVVICTVSDAVLITLGVAGGGVLFDRWPWLTVAARWGGAAFLVAYGLLAARRAIRPPRATGLEVTDAPRSRGGSAATAALTALALTWLNPHVYLDTVVLLGSVANAQGDGRWAFAGGAVLGSVLWFAALGLAARALAPVFAGPRAWRILDAVIAVVMIALGIGLIVSG